MNTLCSLCNSFYFSSACNKCWTMCQTCGRGMNTIDCSNIYVDGFEDADFCIQCASNLFAFDNIVDYESIVKFSQDIRPFVQFFGLTNVLFLSGTTTCVVCNHRILSRELCCYGCTYKYFSSFMSFILPKSHVKEVASYMVRFALN